MRARQRIRVARSVALPDELRVARCRRAPELGPRILFFTGGTALRRLSRVLKLYTHNSIHLVSPFDSGGSSAPLREAFGMLSVGDLRNRLMALADETVRGNPEIFSLFAHRFEMSADSQDLTRDLEHMAEGGHPLVAAVPEPLRHIVRTHIRCFLAQMPASFDLRGASIGNLVLVGGFLDNDRDIDAVIFLFSKLAAVLGVVRPITDAAVHLEAELANGERLVGQHRLTGKEEDPIGARVRDLRLVRGLDDPRPAHVEVSDKVRGFIGEADLICYPMGSFWSSIVANLLPAGVGHAICDSESPKVYVPNSARDPEEVEMRIHDCLETLQAKVSADVGEEVPMNRVVDYVLVDAAHADYGNRLDVDRIQRLGVEVVDVPLVTEESRPLLDATPLVEILLSLS